MGTASELFFRPAHGSHVEDRLLDTVEADQSVHFIIKKGRNGADPEVQRSQAR